MQQRVGPQRPDQKDWQNLQRRDDVEALGLEQREGVSRNLLRDVRLGTTTCTEKNGPHARDREAVVEGGVSENDDRWP